MVSINHNQLDALFSEEKPDTIHLGRGKNILGLSQQHNCKQPPVRNSDSLESQDCCLLQRAELHVYPA